MRRTGLTTLVVVAAIGGAAAWLMEIALVSTGTAVVVPPASLAFALAVLGVLAVVFAIPVRKTVRDREHNHVDPFYAARIAVLAKASSITGALLTGAAVAILVFLLTRSVVPAVGSIVMAVATVIGALVLVAGGLVAEYMCSVPPDDRDKHDDGPATVRPR